MAELDPGLRKKLWHDKRAKRRGSLESPSILHPTRTVDTDPATEPYTEASPAPRIDFVRFCTMLTYPEGEGQRRLSSMALSYVERHLNTEPYTEPYTDPYTER